MALPGRRRYKGQYTRLPLPLRTEECCCGNCVADFTYTRKGGQAPDCNIISFEDKSATLKLGEHIVSWVWERITAYSIYVFSTEQNPQDYYIGPSPGGDYATIRLTITDSAGNVCVKTVVIFRCAETACFECKDKLVANNWIPFGTTYDLGENASRLIFTLDVSDEFVPTIFPPELPPVCDPSEGRRLILDFLRTTHVCTWGYKPNFCPVNDPNSQYFEKCTTWKGPCVYLGRVISSDCTVKDFYGRAQGGAFSINNPNAPTVGDFRGPVLSVNAIVYVCNVGSSFVNYHYSASGEEVLIGAATPSRPLGLALHCEAMSQYQTGDRYYAYDHGARLDFPQPFAGYSNGRFSLGSSFYLLNVNGFTASFA